MTDPTALTIADLEKVVDRLDRIPKIVESKWIPAGEVLLVNEPVLTATSLGFTGKRTTPFDEDWSPEQKLEWAFENGLTIVVGVGS